MSRHDALPQARHARRSPGPATHPVRDGLLPYSRTHRPALLRGLAFAAVLVGARLALPIPLKHMVDSSAAAPGTGGVPVAVLSAWFVGLALAAGVAEHLERLAFAHFAGRTVSDARGAALAGLPESGDEDSAELTAQVLGDCLRVKQGLKGVLNHITVSGMLVVGVVVALALTDLKVGLVALVGTSVLCLVALLGLGRVGAVARQHRQGEVSMARTVHRLVDQDEGTHDPAAFAAMRALDADSGEADIALTRWENLTTSAAHVVLLATAAAALLVGVHAVQAGRMSSGTLFSVMAYLLVLQGPAIRSVRQVTRIGPLLVSARELGALLLERRS
jgi:ABC-type multidrug transport system fused ATPase/permease subunit